MAPPPYEEMVVVITGASSGIGRAAALTFAREGASVVLASRGQEPLGAFAHECEAAGGRALAVPTDVADREAVERLAAASVERFGPIDTWVNNAGVMAYGEFDEIPPEVLDQVIATTLMGQVYGSRAALSRFRRQGSGVLINVCSLWGRMEKPGIVLAPGGENSLGGGWRREKRVDLIRAFLGAIWALLGLFGQAARLKPQGGLMRAHPAKRERPDRPRYGRPPWPFRPTRPISPEPSPRSSTTAWASARARTCS